MTSPPSRTLTCAIVALSCVLLASAGCQPADMSVPSPPTSPTADVSKSSSPRAETAAQPDRPNRITQGLSALRNLGATTPTVLIDATHFQEVAAASGVQFVYDNGAGRQLMVEGTGGGAGWLDYDRDGQWDLYLVQGGDPVESSPSQPSDKLLRNLGSGTFIDVTGLSGVTERRYGQGVSIGDFDNDGFDDIFVANVGGDVLFRNLGDGTFEDASQSLTGNAAAWSTSAAWGDIDLDGDLDLYVCRYCQFDPLHPTPCRNSKGVAAMCQPKHVPPIPDVLFVNQGDGRFLEQARERGLFGSDNRGLGVVMADFDNDAWPDIFVANDATANFLFRNQQRGQFVESAVQFGCALMLSGQAQGSMGVALGDYDRNGFLDLYVANFEGEGDSLYQNHGPNGFQEVSGMQGLVTPTLPTVGWGTVMADFNQDGHEDLFVTNGHIDDGRHVGGDLEQCPLLFSFDGRRWIDMSAKSGDFFRQPRLGRGAAACDYDDDGDLDLVVVHQNSPTALLQNDSSRKHWLKVELSGRIANRRGIGARVIVRRGDSHLMQELAGGTSYCSSSQPCLCFGLGEWSEPVIVEVLWPGGRRQVMERVEIDQRLFVLEE
ncbi:MAG: CRTAC1 family protein [Planctomycetaceae bacterium]